MTTQKTIRYSFFLLAFVAYTKANFTLPNGVQKCNVSDPNFSTCSLTLFDTLVHMGTLGIPSLNIKSLDPIFVKHLCLHSSPGSPISMQLELTNATVYGFANLKIVSTDGTDINRNIIQMKGVIPHLRVLSNYTMDGSIMGINMRRWGTVDVVFYNFTINYQSDHRPVLKNNQTYLTIRNITLDTEYNGGNVAYTTDSAVKSLGLSDEDINNIINQNLGDIYNEYESVVNRAIISAVSPSLVRFNNEVSFEELFVK